MNYITKSANETIRIGVKLGSILTNSDVIALTGELSAGKTHFIKGIARALNIKDEITSPTFTIVNEYSGIIDLNHFDFYRLKNEDDLINIGFDEYIFSDKITVIEWADLIPSCLPESYIEVKINILSDGERAISIKGIGKKYEFLKRTKL
ncbi:MAG: tRNA (adenosine(37)-N6)-threonylcarbamoyltransferase complex ATPase subunit type 1 TsaE [Oscillospiraceae bacterium]|nr:tRNA (adenosine(37)-N6)-threonylcarbamoyltransferase complex ATPase subunit type 1 TsaE [Oscillospiraceae bacterium]